MKAEYLRPGQAAIVLGVSRTTLWRLRKRNDDFPQPRRFAGAARFRRSELLAWADARTADDHGEAS